MSASAVPQAPTTRRSTAWLALALGAIAAGILGYRQQCLQDAIDDLRRESAADRATWREVLGEVTRMRIEQSAGSKGPQALLEKLRSYATLLTSARVTEPDYRAAQKEMEAILRAFAAIGADAWQPVQDRLAALDPSKAFDEIKQLLRAAMAIDRTKGTELFREVLLGRRLPSPRLRWYVAGELTDLDRPLAQDLLRRVLLTESSRGFNPDHAAAFEGAVIPDRAALSASGFHNYVIAYARTEDPRTDETLLMVLGRSEHDRMTVQECVRTLGARRCAAAAPVIEELVRKPPGTQEDPIFLNHCYESLVAIRGADAQSFLEGELARGRQDVVAQRIQALLGRIAGGTAAPTAPADGKPK
ncbi:MAG: hypothetical protein ACK58X_08430 [Planctomycetota bacterium]